MKPTFNRYILGISYIIIGGIVIMIIYISKNLLLN